MRFTKLRFCNFVLFLMKISYCYGAFVHRDSNSGTAPSIQASNQVNQVHNTKRVRVRYVPKHTPKGRISSASPSPSPISSGSTKGGFYKSTSAPILGQMHKDNGPSKDINHVEYIYELLLRAVKELEKGFPSLVKPKNNAKSSGIGSPFNCSFCHELGVSCPSSCILSK